MIVGETSQAVQLSRIAVLTKMSTYFCNAVHNSKPAQEYIGNRSWRCGAGKWATNNLVNPLINGLNIKNPVLSGLINGAIGGAAGGFTGGFILSGRDVGAPGLMVLEQVY